MMKTVLIAFLCGLVLMVSGCANTLTHITKLPTPEEFSKDLSTLEAEYPDLTKYSAWRRYWSADVYTMPEAGPLTEAWDKPHRTRLSAFMLFPVIPWIFRPSTVWTWEYGNKEISALIDHPVACGYRPHVWKLRVEEMK